MAKDNPRYRLARQEIRSVINYYKYGGFDASMAIADHFEKRRGQGKNIADQCICDSQE